MISEIRFKNFRAIEAGKISLGPLNLLVGANGTGKTSVLQAIRLLKHQQGLLECLTIGAQEEMVLLEMALILNRQEYRWESIAGKNRAPATTLNQVDQRVPITYNPLVVLNTKAQQIRHYAFDAATMRAPVQIQAHQELVENGSNLAGFLDFLRDNGAEKYRLLERTVARCIPEFDEIGFDRPGTGQKSFKLRRKGRGDYVTAKDLSEGTIYAIALLAMAYQPTLPTVVCIEEPDRGIQPRLYREIYDALCRLAYPKEHGELFEPIQVIATTHSPYFLNQFTDHPERVTVCEKTALQSVTFRNLGNDPLAKEVLEDSMIGDAWAIGALGGLPTSS